MANALTGYYGGNVAGQNALANAGRQLDPMTGLYFDPSDSSGALYDSAGKQVWDTTAVNSNDPAILAGYTRDSAAQAEGVQRWQAANSMAKGGTNTSAFTTGSPEMAFAFPWIAALGFGGLDAALGTAGVAAGAEGSAGAASTGYGTGTAVGTDTAFGSTAAGVGGESAAGSLTAGADTLGSAAASHPFLSGLNSLAGLTGNAGTGGNMGLGISDWLNIGNTVLGAVSSNRAANVQQGASADAIAELRRQYDTTRADQAPYQAAGVKALGNLSDPNASFMASPDYAFRRSEGQRDLGNSFAARGGAFSGNALRALDQYNQSLASGEFGNWWNRQAGLAGVGQTANAQTGVLGQNTANGVANQIVGAGDARASGIQNTAAILGGGARNFVGNYLYRNAPYQPQPWSGYSPYQGYGG